jgi:hypothetical protein
VFLLNIVFDVPIDETITPNWTWHAFEYGFALLPIIINKNEFYD